MSATSIVDESFLLGILRAVVERHILSNRDGAPPEKKARSTLTLAHDAAENSCGFSTGNAVHADGDDSPGLQTNHDKDAEDGGLEGQLEGLWDLCTDATTSAFLVSHSGIAVLAGAVARTSGEGRLAEIALGILANVCSHKEVTTDAVRPADHAELCAAAIHGASSDDGLVVLQALRLIGALLCSPIARYCSGLWHSEAVGRYLYVLEHSLRWEVVQLACDALSQGLVLEERGTWTSDAKDDLAPADASAFSALPVLSSARLVMLLASRIMELALAAAGEASDAEGDADPALVSALCLAQSFLVVAPCAISEMVPLSGAVLQVLARCDRSDVLGAALEVLAIFFEAAPAAQTMSPWGEDTPASPLAPASPCGAAEIEVAAEEAAALDDMSEQFGAQVRAFMAGTIGLTEKLALLLKDGDGELGDAAATAALALLQHAPRAELEEHREALAAAALEVEPGALRFRRLSSEVSTQ